MTALLPLFIFSAFLSYTYESKPEITKQHHADSVDRAPVQFRIPNNFDVKGAKLDRLKRMLEDRAKWLEVNQAKRADLHLNFMWIFRIVVIAYAVVSLLWIIANILYYLRQRRKFRDRSEENTMTRKLEQERLLQRYNEIPSADSSIEKDISELLPVRNTISSIPMDHLSQFEANRAKVEAVLKRNSEPSFMRRI